MRPVVGDHVATLKPYKPGKPIDELERELGIQGALKLASNENPLGPSPLAVEAIVQHASGVHIYPDGAAFRLKEALAAHYDVPFADLATGNGSNELLTLAARTFCRPGDHAVIADTSFVAYRVIMQAENMRWSTAPLRDGFETDVDAILDAVTPETRIMFLANPNNPTGTYMRAEDLSRILRETPEEVIIVVDEAYHEYVQAEDYASALTMRGLRERLMVTRTFSKIFGMGGMRLGFAVGTPEMMDYLNRVREPFNCNLLTQHAGVAALQDVDFVHRSVAVNEAGRVIMEEGLQKLAGMGVTWTPSQTNFLLAHMPVEAAPVYEGMLRHGVIVRPMLGYGLPNALRITIGTAEQCHRCLNALEQSLAAVLDA